MHLVAISYYFNVQVGTYTVKMLLRDMYTIRDDVAIDYSDTYSYNASNI